jgi:hypothetical protein
MANSGQIVLNKVSSTCPIFDITAPASTINGHILLLGTQASNKVYAASAPVAVTDKEMVIVLEAPFNYAAELTENEAVIATGQTIRAYVPYKGMVVSIPVANITATAALAVDKVVVPVAGNAKMECLAAPAGTEVLIWNIDELYTKSGVAMCKIRCILA